uniref:Putative secreted peptide n=1 Tax=Anopheles braziliensis TaxID=58242 RepID=A0A2M3ZP04_9DIPT
MPPGARCGLVLSLVLRLCLGMNRGPVSIKAVNDKVIVLELDDRTNITHTHTYLFTQKQQTKPKCQGQEVIMVSL